MKTRKLEAYAALVQAQQAERCPPHRFQSGWMDNGEGNAKGAIFCELCGDIRALEPVGVGAPAEEMIPAPLYRPG